MPVQILGGLLASGIQTKNRMVRMKARTQLQPGGDGVQDGPRKPGEEDRGMLTSIGGAASKPKCRAGAAASWI